MSRIGGQVPDSYGLSITVAVADATPTTPIEAGTPLVLSTDGAYQAKVPTNGEAFNLVAKHRVTDPKEPLGVYVYGFSRLDRLAYEGAAPTIGSKVVAGTKGKVKASAEPEEGEEAEGTGFVIYVDTARQYVEVLL